jgi:two-component system sensor histidine kinase/response regulator
LVQSIIGKYSVGGSQVSVADASQPMSQRRKMNAQAPENALDLQLALSRVGGDKQLLREIAVLFIEECPRAVEQIQQAVARGDAAKLENAAHALKGSVANFGARNAVEAAFRLEQMGRVNEMSEAEGMLRNLEGALSAVCAELATL